MAEWAYPMTGRDSGLEHHRDFLQPSELCDFDKGAAITRKAFSLTRGCTDDRGRFQGLYHFVKELPYGLEDWDVKASETLGKGWGMCCGKSNLLVAMCRCLSIPARYRVFRIVAERQLLEWMTEHDATLAGRLGDLPPEQDHVQCDVYVGNWEVLDPSRDSLLEDGLRKLGVPLERVPVKGSDGVPRYTVLASIDAWARKRQRERRYRDNRQEMFAMTNRHLDRIREVARSGRDFGGG